MFLLNVLMPLRAFFDSAPCFPVKNEFPVFAYSRASTYLFYLLSSKFANLLAKKHKARRSLRTPRPKPAFWRLTGGGVRKTASRSSHDPPYTARTRWAQKPARVGGAYGSHGKGNSTKRSRARG